MIDDFSSIDKNNNSIHKAWLEQGSFNEDFIFFQITLTGKCLEKLDKSASSYETNSISILFVIILHGSITIEFLGKL